MTSDRDQRDDHQPDASPSDTDVDRELPDEIAEVEHPTGEDEARQNAENDPPA